MELLTIALLKRAAQAERGEARIHAQVEALAQKVTREGKPFFEIGFADAEAKLTLRAWHDAPVYGCCEHLKVGDFVEISGEFTYGSPFGVEARRWSCRPLSEQERDALLAGPPELCARQGADFAQIQQSMESLADPRMRGLAQLFLRDFEERFRRTAAARQNHHARRGGLVEHVAQMLRSADAIAGAYPGLNRDLLLTGVLFHDCGKLWENALPPDGFTMPFHERGEMLGHITIGIEVVNTLWRKLMETPEAAGWAALQPGTEQVRLHLLHLIASHHGELQFGSPVVPKTPEAWALHYIDNLDARLEMLAVGYQTSRALAPRIQERVRPLPGNLVSRLSHYSPFELP
ncbi:MAG: HD domain-containing protein [Verrucomicrobiota bacterium]|nr:HD domain-containing protein [Verrucomicrobiota bacterium]